MKLSVAMITYNHERYIAQALESVLAQQVNFDYEIIVGEDCSTDSTREIVMDFHRRYPDKIAPLLRDRNVGAMRNLEATLEACRGEYVAFLEGDDYWTCAHKLQQQVDFLDAHPDYAVCCARGQVLNEIGAGMAGVHPRRVAGAYTIEDLLAGNFIITCTSVYRRSLASRVPQWFHEMKLGDWPLHALAARSGKIWLMDDVMATYRVHPGGIWSSMPSIEQFREMARMLTALDEHLEFKYTKVIRRAVARFYCEMASDARRNGRRADTARYLADCVSNGGWWLPGQRRVVAANAAYALMGSWYKIFSRKRET